MFAGPVSADRGGGGAARATAAAGTAAPTAVTLPVSAVASSAVTADASLRRINAGPAYRQSTAAEPHALSPHRGARQIGRAPLGPLALEVLRKDQVRVQRLNEALDLL